MLILLVLYGLLVLLSRKNIVLLLLFSLPFISVLSIILIARGDIIEDVEDVLILVYMFICSTMIILPWGRAKGNMIIKRDDKKIYNIYKILSIILTYTFVVLGVVALVVAVLVGGNIQSFKYEGDYNKFYYTMLPFDVHFYMLAMILYQYAYVMIPLCFYFLQINDKRRVIKCFILSLNVLLYGLTYFSRWAFINFILVYVFMFLLFRKNISEYYKKKIKKIALILGSVLGVIFVSISVSRFSDGDIYGDNVISPDSYIQNPTVYSFLDYLGQSNEVGHALLKSYEGKNFGGQKAFSQVWGFLATFGLFEVGNPKLAQKTQDLYGRYSSNFNGFACGNVYDFGYIFGTLIVFIYFFLVKQRVRKSSVSFNECCAISFLSQMPLLSVFFTAAPTIAFLYFSYIPIYLYLKK